MPGERSSDLEKRIRDAIVRSTDIVAAKKKPDQNDKAEDIAAREAKAKARALEEANADSVSFRTLRERYAKWVFRYLIGYSIFAALVLLANGWNWKGFNVADSVLEFLVGSTTVSAIGLVLAVTHGLFRK